MRLERLLLVGVVVMMGTLTSAQSKAVLWPSAAIKWADSAAAPGAKVAVLWGDPTKGAYGALKQVPGGTVLAPHTHSNDSHVVVVKGALTLEIEGKKTALGAGSYTMIPGKMPHSAACGAGAACEYFEHMTAAFDSTAAK